MFHYLFIAVALDRESSFLSGSNVVHYTLFDLNSEE
jgi:hypothetical protein